MGWVDGKPKLVSERYLGTAADIFAHIRAAIGSAVQQTHCHPFRYGDPVVL